MKINYLITISTFCFLFMGCGGHTVASYTWTHPEKDNSQFAKDQQACIDQLNQDQISNAIGNTQNTTAEKDFNRCLRSKGWSFTGY